MSDGYTVAHLLPRDTPFQRVESAEVHVTPDADELEEHLDAFGNRVVRIGVHHAHEHLGITGRCTVDVEPRALPPDDTTVPWEQAAAAASSARADLALDIGPFTALTPATPHLAELDALAGDVFVPGAPVLGVVRALSARLHRELAFDAEFTDVSTPIATVLAARRGVCQDFAHVALACLRSHGLAARYVSGYIETHPAPGQPKLSGTDASHAWVAVWMPGLGWVDVDPTNDQVPPQRHVTVAWGRDYFDVTPVRGVVIGPVAEQTLSVGVDVSAVP